MDRPGTSPLVDELVEAVVECFAKCHKDHSMVDLCAIRFTEIIRANRVRMETEVIDKLFLELSQVRLERHLADAIDDIARLRADAEKWRKVESRLRDWCEIAQDKATDGMSTETEDELMFSALAIFGKDTP